MKPMIEVHNLSKQYRRQSRRQHDTLRDAIAGWFARSTRSSEPVDQGYFWALHDVTFDVAQGEVMGIIGRNGAGKSTLLKILSRITAPTSGEACLHGRVGSLLEVGTGFHPELTGRENVFLNGAILGMSRQEIRRKFDEIVEFSGVQEFIDTPVKRYSSGMHTRLAFAVAAHLEPDILIIDEVLAVGDIDFQKKCLGKMQDVSRDGRTVLFVSHNLNVIRNLCTRCIFLDHGQLVLDSDDVDSVVAAYLRGSESPTNSIWVNPGNRFDDEIVKPLRFFVADSSGAVLDRPVSGDETVSVNIEFELRERIPNFSIGFAVVDPMGGVVFWSYQTDHSDFDNDRLVPGINRISTSLPPNLLNDGDYSLKLIAGVQRERALLTIQDSDISLALTVIGNKKRSGYWSGRRNTPVGPVLEWQIVVRSPHEGGVELQKSA